MEIKMISEETYKEFGNVLLDSYDKIIAGTLDEKGKKQFQELYIKAVDNCVAPDWFRGLFGTLCKSVGLLDEK